MRLVEVFFYGSFMNPKVLTVAGVDAQGLRRARLDGFTLEVKSGANLMESDGESVYGMVGRVNHVDLNKLYGQELLSFGSYFVEPTLVSTDNGFVPALCYIAPKVKDGLASKDYIDTILEVAEKYSFPESYIAMLKTIETRA